ITDILTLFLVRRSDHWLKRLPVYLLMALIGALATTAWDMMIDPIAVSQGWWVWHEGGAYMPYVANGVPIQNFLGWLGVAFTIMFVYRLITETISKPEHTINLSIYGPITLYISLFLTSMGVTVTILQRLEIALVGLLVMGPFIVIALTNINIVQRGLATLLGGDWFEVEIKNGRVKAGNR
ncbi:MAG: carotenoid biosynthesis protein, partial [Anaerolineaceae bacterium]|nr:carotenoid biosynthesis protein [Anaerolineaceae bacterium]